MSATRSSAGTGAVCATLLCLTGATTAPALASPPRPSATVSSLDTQLLTAGHQGNLWEIATGQAAQTDATSACVKQVGAVFIRDHRALDAGLVKTASKLGVALPSGQTAGQQRQAVALKAAARTRSYDAAWLKAQYTAHVQTLSLIDKEIAAGTNPQVKALAKSARPVVERHTRLVSKGVCHSPMAASSRPSASAR
ncbi:DUF4142 domain-containing protein [Streptomyces sp. RB6PN25]|uniref:DUF4142 domain-containing protein n=1 Tax=Streptomyces humicola TaxID=2953240 RepID=A0ABT1PSK8_9ACTN|nr:DUF4142 domain-containing protein [Streptomyces humicola]MCQ4080636.1 DUF4142 domain-containing protein [Streptomyces humicola]